MKIITQQQYDKLKFLPFGKRLTKDLTIEKIYSLKVGQILQIDKEDWVLLTSVADTLATRRRQKHRPFYGRRFITRTLANKGGWVVKRIK